jgi:Ras association domain-containing protein 2/4
MLKEDEYPLMVRVMLGPHEDVAKLYLMDRGTTEEISSEVAQFLNLSTTECNAILERYKTEQSREERRIIAKYVPKCYFLIYKLLQIYNSMLYLSIGIRKCAGVLSNEWKT